MIATKCVTCRRIYVGEGRTARHTTSHQRAHFSRLVEPLRAAAKLITFQEADIEILETIGGESSSSKSTTPKQDAAAALDSVALSIEMEALGMLMPQATELAAVEVQLYRGKVKQGVYSNTDVSLKAYPRARGSDTDLLVTNEVAAHSSLQLLPGAVPLPGSDNIAQLLGTFDIASGGQTLVFRRDAGMTAESYCRQSAEELHGQCEQADENFWQEPRTQEMLNTRKGFIKRVIRQLLEGLEFAHRRNRVHQRLSPSNILLSCGHHSKAADLLVQLQNFSLAADISDSAFIGGATLGEIWEHNKIENDDPLKRLSEPIWERARTVGAISAREQRVFAISEDIAAAGLLLAYLSLAPFCTPNSISFNAVQRLFGVTFQSELGAAREYCEADDRWHQGVAFLNEDVGSGWDLIQSMIFPDFKLRPTAESCLNHPFLSVAAQKA